MKRADALNLTNHHYRLYSGIRPVVDSTPPVCMYSSPKSIHYKPFHLRRQGSVKSLNEPKRKGKEELTHFISQKNVQRPQSHLGFNSIARSSSFHLKDIKIPSKKEVSSKLLTNRNYYPPSKSPSSKPPKPYVNYNVHDHSTQPHSSQTTQERYHSEQKRHENQKYREFKENVVDLILLRGVYSDSVITNCFKSEMDKRSDLDYDLMYQVMCDTLLELNVSSTRPSKVKSKSHVRFPKRRSHSLSSASWSSDARSSVDSQSVEESIVELNSAESTSSSNKRSQRSSQIHSNLPSDFDQLSSASEEFS